MTADEARAALEDAIRTAQDETRACRSRHGSGCEFCAKRRDEAMAAADAYAEAVAAGRPEPALSRASESGQKIREGS